MNIDTAKRIVKRLDWIMELEALKWTEQSWEETRDFKWGQRVNDQ